MTRKRLISLALALAFALTCLPLFGGIALAEEADIEAPLAITTDEGIEGDIVSGNVEPSVEEIEVELGGDEAEDAAGFDVSPAAPEAHYDSVSTDTACRRLRASVTDHAGSDVPKDYTHDVQVVQNGGLVSIYGSISEPYVLFGVIVDGTVISDQYFGSYINFQFDINNGSFSTGYHTVCVGVGILNPDGTMRYENQYLEQKYVEANTISAVPTYAGVFQVYHDHIDYYPYSMAMDNMAGKLYMEYSADGGQTWNRSGYMSANWIKLFIQQGFTIDGLYANTTYMTRIRYGEEVTYSTYYDGDGATYTFLGPALTTATFTTGMPEAPKIKSIKAKAVKVKYHKHRVAGHYEWAGTSLIWIGPWTEKYYTCNVKVTVKLKKKPGTKGVWIGFTDMSGYHEKWVSGNKKTYKATFTPYINYFAKKPKGHYSYEITVRSGQDENLGGYSPAFAKTKKLS